MKFHWNGQSGQPSWLWGGNSATDMYLYNPSNFSVNYANSAGYATNAGNANTVGGYTAAQLIAAAQAGVSGGSTVAVLTGVIARGIGTKILPLPNGFTEGQCTFLAWRVYTYEYAASYTVPALGAYTTRTFAGDTHSDTAYIVIGVK